jgi:hypothetical protein
MTKNLNICYLESEGKERLSWSLKKMPISNSSSKHERFNVENFEGFNIIENEASLEMLGV